MKVKYSDDVAGLDRIFVKLRDWRLDCIEMVGTEPIPGVTYEKEYKQKEKTLSKTLPVLPSDHFGLYAELAPK